MKLLNIFALIGFLLLFGKLFFFGADGNGSWEQMQWFSKILLIWGMLGGVFLWVSMLIDHFKYSRVQRKVAWGLFLVFGHVLAAVLYFFFVYLTAKNNEKKLTNK